MDFSEQVIRILQRTAQDVGGVQHHNLIQDYSKFLILVLIITILSHFKSISKCFWWWRSLLASYNRKFEKYMQQIPYLSFSQTKLKFVQTTNVSPIDDNVKTFTSYSHNQNMKRLS